MKKAYLIDLDNTIYFTRPNVSILLEPLYQLLEAEDLGISTADFEKAKEEMMRTPFGKVADKYHFKEEAVSKAIAFLQTATVTSPLQVHDDYHYLKALNGLKFIVTAGFEKLQRSKIEMLGVTADFDEVIVVDQTKTSGDKKDAFLDILKSYQLDPADVLVIGDDPDSEINHGLALGMETFLFDPERMFPDAKTTYHGTTFNEIGHI